MKTLYEEAMRRGLVGPPQEAGITPRAVGASAAPRAVGEGAQQTLSRGFGSKEVSDKIRDLALSAGTGFAKGLSDIVGLPGNIGELGTSLADALVAKVRGRDDIDTSVPGSMSVPFPTSEDVQQAASTVTGIKGHTPESTAGRYVEAAARGAAGAPAGPAGMLAGATGGVAGEAAGQAGANPILQAVAAMIGSAAGPAAIGTVGKVASGAGGLIKSLPGGGGIGEGVKRAGQALQSETDNAAKLLRRNLSNLTDEEIAAAKQAQETARRVGVPLTGPEALPQGTIRELARDVRANPTGGSIFEKALKDRPQRVEQAAKQAMKKGTGRTAIVDPTAVGQRAQRGATDVIRKSEKGRTSAVKPYYEAAASDVISETDATDVLNVAKEALNNASTRRVRNALRPLVKDIESLGTNPTVAQMDDVYKTYRDLIDMPEINANALDKATAAKMRPVLNKIDETLMATSEDLSKGRQTYRTITEKRVKPLQDSSIGDVAKSKNVKTIINKVFGNTGVKRTKSITKDVYEMSKTDPDAIPDLARLYLENTFDKASKRIQTGPTDKAGANWANQIIGNETQKRNLRAVIRSIAKTQKRDPDETWKAFEDIIETLGKTGGIPGIGSPTASRQATQRAAEYSSQADLIESAASGKGFVAGVVKAMRDAASEGTYTKLAEVMTAPDAVEQMIKLSKSPTQRKALVSGLQGIREGSQL
jgi:hypothetical protein